MKQKIAVFILFSLISLGSFAQSLSIHHFQRTQIGPGANWKFDRDSVQINFLSIDDKSFFDSTGNCALGFNGTILARLQIKSVSSGRSVYVTNSAGSVQLEIKDDLSTRIASNGKDYIINNDEMSFTSGGFIRPQTFTSDRITWNYATMTTSNAGYSPTVDATSFYFRISPAIATSSSSVFGGVLDLRPTYNLTGSATGDVYGIKYEPTITSLLGINYAFYATSGRIHLGAMSGGGTQYVTVDNNGDFNAAAAIPGGAITGAALTKTDDTNVTVTLGGSPSTALLNAASLTLGWTGQLGISRGGTGAATTSAFQVFGRGSGSGAPSFLSLDTTFISSFYTKVRAGFSALAPMTLTGGKYALPITDKWVVYGSGGTTVASNQYFNYDPTTNNLGVGSTNSENYSVNFTDKTGRMEIVGTGYGAETQVRGRYANGTEASPSAVAAGDPLFAVGGTGWDGSVMVPDFAAGVKIIGNPSGATWTGADHGAFLGFAVIPAGSTTLSVVGRWDGNGLNIGATSSPAYKLSVTGDINATGAYRVGGTLLKDLSEALTNKTFALGSNTVSGTLAQFNTALTGDDFASLTGAEVLTNKSMSGTTNTFTNIPFSALSLGMTATQTSTVTITNSAAAATLLSMTGTTTIAAGEMIVGKTYQFELTGYLSTIAASAGNLTVLFKIGGTTVNTSGTVSLPTSLANRQIVISGTVTCRSTGVSGTVFSQGGVQMNTSASAFSNREMIQTGTTTINTTTSNAFDITWTFSVNDPGNTIVITNGYIRPIN